MELLLHCFVWQSGRGGGGRGRGNGAVSFSFEVCIFLVLHPASKLGTNESGVS